MFHSHKLAFAVAVALVPAASFADQRAGGEQTTGDIVVDNAVDETTDVWDILETETFDLTSSSDMVATACSDFDNPSGPTANSYRYVIAIDSDVGFGPQAGLNNGAERTIDDLYDDPNKDDPDQIPVCTTRFFSNVAGGSHTLHVLAAKTNVGMANVTVLDTSLSIVALSGTEL